MSIHVDLYCRQDFCSTILDFQVEQSENLADSEILQIIWYGGGVFLAVAALEVATRLWYMHAIARSGIWKDMESVTGVTMEASELLSMALFSLLFTTLKVGPGIWFCTSELFRTSHLTKAGSISASLSA